MKRMNHAIFCMVLLLAMVSVWGSIHIAAMGTGGLVIIFNYSTGNKRWAVTVNNRSTGNNP